MTRIAPRPILILVAFLFIPLIADSVFAQDQSGRYDILRGTNNESSCQLKDKIHSTCNFSITAPPLNVTPTASLCTCNKIFFNIWSACSYASGNHTLPVFSLWTSTCTNQSVNLAESVSLSTFKGGLGIDIPVWAFPDVPGNTSFDLQQAVVLVHLAPKPWSTLQIVAPLIAAILSIIITLFSASFYQRKNLGRIKWREEFVHRLRPPRKIKPVHHLRSEWEIDQESEHHEDPVTKGDEPFVATSTTPLGQYTISGHSAVGRSRTSSMDAVRGNLSRSSESLAGSRQRTAVGLSGAGNGTDTIPGNPSRHSESSGGTRDSTAVERSGAGDTIPGNPSLYSEPPGGTDVNHRTGIGRGYPFGPSHQVQARRPLIPVRHLPSTTDDSELNTNRGWRFPGSGSFTGKLLRPWKRVPEKLVEVQPTRRFRVDPSTTGSGIGHSTIGSETTRDSAVTSSYPRRSFDIADHLEGESDSLDYQNYVHNGDGDVGSDDEGTNLISPKEKEERKSGMTTTSLATTSTNPNINIVSPTVSSSSPTSTRIVGPSPLKTNVRPAVPVIPPIIPPPPTQPAPAVPANMFRRALQRRRDNVIEVSTNQQPLIFPDRLTMTPIQEGGSEEGMSSIRRSPSPIPTRSNSNDQQDASGPSRSVPKPTPSDELQRPSHSPVPSISGQALPYYLRAYQRAASPTPSLHENLTNGSPNLKAKTSLSRLLPFEPISLPMYSHQRSASSSASLTRNHDDNLGDPLLSKPIIRRGLSADDLNLTPLPLSATPPLRIGSPRPQVGRDSASELFPSSVRSAGYRGIPNF